MNVEVPNLDMKPPLLASDLVHVAAGQDDPSGLETPKLAEVLIQRPYSFLR